MGHAISHVKEAMRRMYRVNSCCMLLGLIIVFTLLIAGCTAVSDSEKVVEFWAIGREGEVISRQLEDFEADNPGLSVRVQSIPWNAAREKLLTAHIGDATPDIAQLGNTWIPEFKELGALVDLTDRTAESPIITQDHYFEGIWATNEVEGALVGIPWYVDTRLLYYRRDLFEEVGFDRPPATWDEWETLMRRLRAQMPPSSYPIFLATDEWQPPAIFAMQSGSSLLDPEWRYGDFLSDAFRQGFRFYLSMYENEWAPPVGYQQITNLYQELAAGNFAMFISGPWNLPEMHQRLPGHLSDDWMTAPLPGPDGSPGVSVAGGSSLVIFQNAQHVEAAWKVIEFLSQPDQMMRFHHMMGSLPPRMDVWQKAGLTEDQYASAFWDQLRHVKPTPQIPEWEQIASQITMQAEIAARGRVSADESLIQLNRDVNQILDKRRWIIERRSN